MRDSGEEDRLMDAAVFRGRSHTVLERVPVPEIGPGEILLQVRCCGICSTDLKKIKYGLQAPPRIYGHEISGRVAQVGSRVSQWQRGDRVVCHHHIPCGDCFFCRRGLHAQCSQYKRTGTTAGFDPAGGGFAQYVRVMEWVVGQGVIPIPDPVSFEKATFLEPVNTCLKGVERLGALPGEWVLLFGLGPIGLILLQLVRLEGLRVMASDPIERRRGLARQLGAASALSPDRLEATCAALTEGRGADAAILACDSPSALSQAVSLTRPGARILLFAHTRKGDRREVDLGTLCRDEKEIVGSYSASIKLQRRAARLVFEDDLDTEGLITHRFALSEIEEALFLAAYPSGESLKIVVEPWR
ncbi:MAG: alcohol dehydrogenase catalytic domain-containing protein [Acidobacteriota bacterium]